MKEAWTLEVILAPGLRDQRIKSIRQSEKPEELESEFDHFDVDNSCPTSPFKALIVDSDFVHKQLLNGIKLAKPHYPSHIIKEKD